MDTILNTYSDSGFFTFHCSDDLKSCCKAPDKKSGVYLVYDRTAARNRLIYIGSSGHIDNSGALVVRKSGGGGLKGRIVNGHQFGSGAEYRRFKIWPIQMKKDGIDRIDVHWYVTHADNFAHSPCYVEHLLLHEYYTMHHNLPLWNKKF